MLERKERRAVLWTLCALTGAACLAREAMAGNVLVTTPTAAVEYFSVEMAVGDYLRWSPVDGHGDRTAILIDDITYAPDIAPDAGTVPAHAVLWSATTQVVASYEWPMLVQYGAGPPYPCFAFGTGPLRSGTMVQYDTEVWSDAKLGNYSLEMQETDSSGNFIRAFDSCTHVFHAALFGRQTTFEGGLWDRDDDDVRATTFGVGISEAIATLSESRHYQTPHIVPITNEVHVASVGTQSYSGARVYVKGRVVFDTLTEAPTAVGNSPSPPPG